VILPAAKPIHLDTDLLIRALVPNSPEADKLRGWLEDRRTIAMSALAWEEFLCGPLDDLAQALARRIGSRHLPVGTDEAAEAARLFNLVGRRQGSFPDYKIAATAILAGAELARANLSDFKPFLEAGLRLAK